MRRYFNPVKADYARKYSLTQSINVHTIAQSIKKFSLPVSV